MKISDMNFSHSDVSENGGIGVDPEMAPVRFSARAHCRMGNIHAEFPVHIGGFLEFLVKPALAAHAELSAPLKYCGEIRLRGKIVVINTEQIFQAVGIVHEVHDGKAVEIISFPAVFQFIRTTLSFHCNHLKNVCCFFMSL